MTEQTIWVAFPKEKLVSYEDLTILALDSAITLENLIQNQHADTSPVDRLLTILQESPGLGVGSNDRVQHISPTALAVYSRTLRQTGEAVNTLDDIMTKILSVTKNFDEYKSDANLNKSDGKLKRLRNFCLALHEELLSETFGVENNYNWEEREPGRASGIR